MNAIKCYKTYDTFSASKQFPGWIASVFITVGFLYKGTRAVVVTFETDYHGAPAATALAQRSVAPLTVKGIADSCAAR